MPNIRSARGKKFERDIEDEFNFVKNKETGERVRTNWFATVLGSASTKLPDLCIVNNISGIMIAVEAKSTIGNIAYIPLDEIQRCIKWTEMLAKYETARVVFAFKFGARRSKNSKIYNTRKQPKYYYFIVKYFTRHLDLLKHISCDEDGAIRITFDRDPDEKNRFMLTDDFMKFDKRVYSITELKTVLMELAINDMKKKNGTRKLVAE